MGRLNSLLVVGAAAIYSVSYVHCFHGQTLSKLSVLPLFDITDKIMFYSNTRCARSITRQKAANRVVTFLTVSSQTWYEHDEIATWFCVHLVHRQPTLILAFWCCSANQWRLIDGWSSITWWWIMCFYRNKELFKAYISERDTWLNVSAESTLSFSILLQWWER